MVRLVQQVGYGYGEQVESRCPLAVSSTALAVSSTGLSSHSRQYKLQYTERDHEQGGGAALKEETPLRHATVHLDE